MKLYNLPRGSAFKLLSSDGVPPDAPPVSEGETYYLDHIDGMYSLCRDSAGRTVHIFAGAEVGQPIK